MIVAENSEGIWLISDDDLHVMKKNIKRAMDITNYDYEMSFGVETVYHRKLPPKHRKATLEDVKPINPNISKADCLTR